MKRNAKILAWAGLLAFAFVVASPLSAQTQNKTQQIQNRTQNTQGCIIDEPGGACSEMFTNVNGLCVTEHWEATPKCENGLEVLVCTLVSKSKTDAPCTDPGTSGSQSCIDACE